MSGLRAGFRIMRTVDNAGFIVPAFQRLRGTDRSPCKSPECPMGPSTCRASVRIRRTARSESFEPSSGGLATFLDHPNAQNKRAPEISRALLSTGTFPILAEYGRLRRPMQTNSVMRVSPSHVALDELGETLGSGLHCARHGVSRLPEPTHAARGWAGLAPRIRFHRLRPP